MDQAIRYLLTADASGLERGLKAAGGSFGSWKTKMVAGLSSVSALALKAGSDFDKAADLIVEGTGMSRDAAIDMLGDLESLNKFGIREVGNAAAELNTFLGLTGKELELVAGQALKSRVDVGLFGSAAKQMGLDAKGSADFLDTLKGVSQATGVSQDRLLQYINRNIPRFRAMGIEADDTAAMVLRLAEESGPDGLRGAISELQQGIDTGMIPSLGSLDDLTGTYAGSVQHTYEETRTWRDVLGEAKNAAIGAVGPFGDMAGAVGSFGVAALGLGQLGPMFGTLGGILKVFWATAFGPVGLAIGAVTALGAAAWHFRDEILGALRAVARFVQPWVDRWLTMVEAIVGWIPGVGDKLSGMVATARTKFGEFAHGVTPAVEAVEEVGPAVFDAQAAVDAATPSLMSQVKAYDDTKDAAKAVKEEAEEVAKVYTADLIPAVSLADDAVVDAHINIRKLAEANKQELIPSNNEVALTFIQNQIDMAATAEREQQRIEDDARATAEAYQQIWTNAFQGVNGMLGALKQTIAKSVFDSDMFNALQGKAAALGEKLGSKFGGTMGGIFSSAFSGLASAGISAAINLGMKGLAKLGGYLKRLFGGISEEAIEGKDAFADVAREANAAYADQASQEARFQDLIAHGWEERDAAMFTFFQNQALQSGRSLAEAEEQWHAYHAAMKKSDTDAMKAIEDNVLSWHDHTAAAAEDNEQAVESSFSAQTVESKKMTDAAIQNTKDLAAAVKDMGAAIKAATDNYVDHWRTGWLAIRNDATATAAHITNALNAIPDKTVMVNYVRTGDTGGGSPTVNLNAAINADGRELARVVMSHMPREAHLAGAR